MIFLKPNRVIIDLDMEKKLKMIAQDILLNKPQVMVLPEWVDVIETRDIKEENEWHISLCSLPEHSQEL